VVSGEETGLVFDLVPDSAPSKPAWGSLREVPPSMWLRLIPGVLRQVFSGREPVGGLPVVEPGQSRPADLPEVDFGDSYPTADHSAAEADAVTAAAGVVAGALAEQADYDAGTGPYACELAVEDAGAAASGQAAEAATAQAVAELGEVGL
jgi:hypothetical protein